MKTTGKIWKSRKDQFWLADIPLLDLMVQADNKEEIPEMAKEVIELLVNNSNFKVKAEIFDNKLLIDSNDPKRLIALILKRQRSKYNLTLEDVTKALKAKSINEYAQYEQGKYMPSIEKFEELFKAINPQNNLAVSLLTGKNK